MLLLIFQLVIVMHQIKLNDEPEPELDNIILVAIRKRGKEEGSPDLAGA